MQQDLFSLQWLVGDRITSVVHCPESESWLLKFQSEASLYIGCMWRLLEGHAIASTSFDHGHLFGLEKPFNGEMALSELLKHAITDVNLRTGISDLALTFAEAFVLEVIPVSGGYESWSASHPTLGQVICGSGGELHAILAHKQQQGKQ